MIYCVIPRELEVDLNEKMIAYYAGNPNVTVMIDRREGSNRRRLRAALELAEQREVRDRRRPRAIGTFPSTSPLDP